MAICIQVASLDMEQEHIFMKMLFLHMKDSTTWAKSRDKDQSSLRMGE